MYSRSTSVTAASSSDNGISAARTPWYIGLAIVPSAAIPNWPLNCSPRHTLIRIESPGDSVTGPVTGDMLRGGGEELHAPVTMDAQTRTAIALELRNRRAFNCRTSSFN